MPHVHLPAQHSDEDLELAGALARCLNSSELYVAWSTRAGSAEPVVAAALREPEPAPAPAPRAAGLRFLRDRLRRRPPRR